MNQTQPEIPHGPALRRHLLQQLDAAIATYRTTLHPEDAQMASMEFRAWMKLCDRADQSELEFYAARALNVIRSAASDTDAHRQMFVAMRRPHATYAQAALKARFPSVSNKE